MIQAEKQKLGLERILVGFESTGCYGIPFMMYLDAVGISMVQVNPSHTKKAKSFDDNSPLKSDQKDPRVIANLIKHKNYLSVIIPRAVAAELRSLTTYRDRLIGDRTRFFNQMHALLFILKCF